MAEKHDQAVLSCATAYDVAVRVQVTRVRGDELSLQPRELCVIQGPLGVPVRVDRVEHDSADRNRASRQVERVVGNPGVEVLLRVAVPDGATGRLEVLLDRLFA